MSLDVLAVGAHPDDIELTCAGFLLRARERGAKIGIVDLCHGEMGSRGSREERDQEAAAATQVLGLDFRTNLDLPDGAIRYEREAIIRLVEVIRQCRPRLLLGPYERDHHPDHIAAAQIVRDAWWFSGTTRYPARGEAHRPDQLIHYLGRYDYPPSFILDISSVYEVKKAAAACYHSQFYTPKAADGAAKTYISSPDFFLHWEGKQRHFGAQIGTRFGEPFIMESAPPIYDPLFLLNPNQS